MEGNQSGCSVTVKLAKTMPVIVHARVQLMIVCQHMERPESSSALNSVELEQLFSEVFN